MKNKTGKKITVVGDELQLKKGGLYCYMPYENVDAKNKAVFKIGLAINFEKRTENYHTYFPLGVYMLDFLEAPPVPKATRLTQAVTKKSHYITIESFILKYIDTHGGKRVYSSTRIKNPNLEKLGETEWSYTNENIIHEAFNQAHKKYGGTLHAFYLEGIDPTTNKLTTINDIAKENEKHKPNYIGKNYFPYINRRLNFWRRETTIYYDKCCDNNLSQDLRFYIIIVGLRVSTKFMKKLEKILCYLSTLKQCRIIVKTFFFTIFRQKNGIFFIWISQI